MADENATLRDSVVNDTAAAADTTTATDTTQADTTAAAALALEDVDALEIGRILRDSGVTKDKVNDLLQAPSALAALRHIVVNDPKELVRMVEKVDPGAGTRILDQLSEMFLERNPVSKGGTVKDTAENAGLLAQITQLSEKTNQLLTREQQREQAAMTERVKNLYNGRVDDMLNQDGMKALKLTKAETKAFRASLDQQLGSDPAAVQRINAGNFVDVPRVFKGIVEEWAGDRKAAAKAETEARERSEKNASLGYPLGADAQLLDIPANAADSWEDTEAALAKAFQRSMGKK